VRQHEGWAVRHRRLHTRREVAGREARALPVVMLPGRPFCLAVSPRDLLRAIEPPHFLALEIELHKRRRLLMRRATATPRNDESAGQNARGTAGDASEAGPPLYLTAVHVDHDDAFVLRRVEYSEAIPGFIGVVDRGPGGIHRGRPSQRSRYH